MTDKDIDCGSIAQGDEMECPGCGRVLPETTGQDWEVDDGQELGCGCAGCWSADGEHAWPVHDDECLQCARDEIEDMRAKLARHTECRSVSSPVALSRGHMETLLEITGPSGCYYIQWLVEAVRALELALEATEQESVAVPFVHARRLLDWLRWPGTDDWDSTEPGPPEWRDAFLAFERVVGEAEKRLGPPPPYCGHTEGVQATEQEPVVQDLDPEVILELAETAGDKASELEDGPWFYEESANARAAKWRKVEAHLRALAQNTEEKSMNRVDGDA